jgi:molybdopterin-guanine dinucleotide biosynthesis protein A
MGGDKAEIVVDGVIMLDRVAAALGAAAEGIVVLGRQRRGWECWPDEAPGGGPLSGIATALRRMGSGRALFLAVDQPFARPETLRELAGLASELPVVPVDREGVRQVTCAVYPASVADAAWEEAESGGSVQSLLDRVSFEPVTHETWEDWGEDGRSWFSIDTPEDLAEGLRRFGSCG